MNAFKRLDHLLCDVPDIEEAFDVFHRQLGFPVAWPIGRFWPGGRTCGIALGGANVEFIQSDKDSVSEAMIRTIALEPARHIQEVFRREGIPYEEFEKKEGDQDLLRLRGMKLGAGEQLLCTNTLPDNSKLEFPFFACDYEASMKARLAPSSFVIPEGNALEEIVLGCPDPEALVAQMKRLGIEGGVRLTAHKHPTKEVITLIMRNGPFNLGPWPARFRFVGSAK